MKKIALTAPHEHDGREYPVGTEIEVSEAAADWLIAAGRAKPAAATHYTAKAAPKAIESTQDKEQQA